MRLDDATALLQAGRWSAAYYLAGYVVECALKSCVLRHLHDSGAIFADKKYLTSLADCWTHDLVKLLSLGGLTAAHGIEQGANQEFRDNWSLVKEWKETSRYEEHSEAEARSLYGAVAQDPNGVLVWIQRHW